MASDISKRIDEIIKTGIAPVLKQRGFRKAGRNFHRAAGEAVQAINIQADKWNEGGAGRFTVNVGVYFRAVAEIAERWVVEDVPKEYECTVRGRLGIMPKPGDKWWVLDDNSDDYQVTRDVADVLSAYGLPWLELSSTRSGLRSAFAMERQCFDFDPRSPIALEILDGNRERAVALLRERIKGAKNARFCIQMTEWGHSHGLP